ncbi:autotransporter-associated beta strand repeat-containing protein, partial [bacterium]|nr:autotransporter-associated beta strand repeat-containing protein [bacterium]
PALGGTEDGGLTKLGYGMLTLSNACNYTGPTVVESGTLILNTLGKTKFLAVDDATVGDVSGDLTITAGTTVSPGSSVGTMHTQSNLVMQSGSIYDWEVGAYYLADLINVNSKLDISGAAANSITVNVNSIGAVMPEETNILFAAGIIDGNASSIFMSYAIGNSGPVNPTINGNNIEIADIIIPEPGIVSIICLLTFAFFGRNKK